MARDHDPRAARVLAVLGEDGGRPATFQALRRRLGLHPQALVRTLRSLVRGGHVEKEGRQFRLPPAVAATLPALPLKNTVPLLVAVLPPGLSAAEAARRLEHRWFRLLHWYGRRGEGEAIVLTWTTEAGARLHLRVAEHALRLEVEADAEADPAAFAAARHLVAALPDLWAAPAATLVVRA